MKPKLVIVRPEPGASATKERAQGWDVIKAPLFRIESCDWNPPAAKNFDALMVTSANAIRYGGNCLSLYRRLPLFAVGKASADAADDAGFQTVIAGDQDAGALAGAVLAAGHHNILHLAGHHTRRFDEAGLSITRIPVYESVAIEPVLLRDTFWDLTIVMLHSPRAARHFAHWCTQNGIDRQKIVLVGISPSALAEAGDGWHKTIAAEYPTDEAMLAVAQSLPL